RAALGGLRLLGRRGRRLRHSFGRRQLHPERAALAGRALGAYAPAVELDELPGDGQPEAGGGLAARRLGREPLEVLEEPASVLLGETGTGVAHGEADDAVRR